MNKKQPIHKAITLEAPGNAVEHGGQVECEPCKFNGMGTMTEIIYNYKNGKKIISFCEECWWEYYNDLRAGNPSPYY